MSGHSVFKTRYDAYFDGGAELPFDKSEDGIVDEILGAADAEVTEEHQVVCEHCYGGVKAMKGCDCACVCHSRRKPFGY